MEFEDRNSKPEEPSNKLPITVLVVLISIICLLLYAGWQLMSDDASTVTELKENSTPSITSKSEELQDTNSHVEVDKIASVDEEKNKETIVQPATGPEEEVENPKSEVSEKPKDKPKEKLKESSETKESTNSSGIITSHVVKEGETLFSISKRYNINTSTLKKANGGIESGDIKLGETKLKIPVKAIHTVGPGDILRVVAEKYDISVDLLMSANGKTKNYAARGEKLVIPNKNKE